MRVLLVSTALLCIAACAPQPQGPAANLTAPPGAPVALTAAAPAPVAQPLPPPAASPAPSLFPMPFAAFRPRERRLMLSNYSVERMNVETVVTANPVCGAGPGGVVATADFVLPLNGTRVVAAPPGTDVCWRRAADMGTGAAAPHWSPWNRAYLSTGGSVDTRP